MTLGRVGALMSVNFGGCITGVVRSDSGNPIHSVCFAEDVDGLPPGWVGFNEESTYYEGRQATSITPRRKAWSARGSVGLLGLAVYYPSRVITAALIRGDGYCPNGWGSRVNRASITGWKPSVL